MDRLLRHQLEAALQPLPDADGTADIVMATAGSPPVIAILSTGDMLLHADTLLVGLGGANSVVDRLGGAFSLLVRVAGTALHVGVVEATAERYEEMVRIEGRLQEIQRTAWPSWVGMHPLARTHSVDRPMQAYLAYWADLRSWLKGDGPPPNRPPILEDSSGRPWAATASTRATDWFPHLP